MAEKRDFYVIVHEQCIRDEWAAHRNPSAQTLGRKERYPGVIAELDRIRREELFHAVNDMAGANDFLIPDGAAVRVCGAYFGRACVDVQMLTLARRRIENFLHVPGTIILPAYEKECGL